MRLLLTVVATVVMVMAGWSAPASGASPLDCGSAPSPAPLQSASGSGRSDTFRNGLAYLYAGGNLVRDFSLSADLTLPEVASNRGLFYTSWLLLIPLAALPQPFVQIELMRWRAFDFRLEVGITWQLPGGHLVYRDTPIFLDPGKHLLKIAVKDDVIELLADQRVVCTGSFATFFKREQKLYFQIGNEVAKYGDRISGTVENIRLKTDDDAEPKPLEITCMLRDRGLSWESDGSGRFVATGVFTDGAPSHFTGISPDTRCKI